MAKRKKIEAEIEMMEEDEENNEQQQQFRWWHRVLWFIRGRIYYLKAYERD